MRGGNLLLRSNDENGIMRWAGGLSLQLPPDCRIHAVFHVSKVNKFHGNLQQATVFLLPEWWATVSSLSLKLLANT